MVWHITHLMSHLWERVKFLPQNVQILNVLMFLGSSFHHFSNSCYHFKNQAIHVVYRVRQKEVPPTSWNLLDWLLMKIQNERYLFDLIQVQIQFLIFDCTLCFLRYTHLKGAFDFSTCPQKRFILYFSQFYPPKIKMVSPRSKQNNCNKCNIVGKGNTSAFWWYDTWS